MPTAPGSAHPPGLAAPVRVAGPLTPDSFAAAVFHASSVLAGGDAVPGVARPLPVPDLWEAALNVVDPYCDGDRNAAVEAIADALTPAWRTGQPVAQQAALAEATALLTWLEGHDPARN